MSVQARPYHHGNLRAALLRSAEAALIEQGPAALSLRELARQVGVSHAAPRRHFADKQALLDALAVDGFERIGQALGEAIDGAGDRFADRFLAFARSYVGFATAHAALLELMFAAKHQPGAAEAISEAATRAFIAPRALIAAGQAAGEVSPGDPERVALVTWATLQGLAGLANAGMVDRPGLDAVVAEAAARLLAGLRPRP